MNTLVQLQRRINIWAGRVVPDRKPIDAAIKLVSEVSELLDAIHSGQGSVADELGDCMILLLDIAKLSKVNLVEAAHAKMTTNENRTWQNVGGVLRHVTGSRHENR